MENDKNVKVTTITLAVNRAFKNSEGIYETDFIKCVLWNGIATNTCEYCKQGSVVGIKGRIQTSNYITSENEKKYVTEVIAERITFLSSNSKFEAEKENAES